MKIEQVSRGTGEKAKRKMRNARQWRTDFRLPPEK
jgi:hypothetical protein